MNSALLASHLQYGGLLAGARWWQWVPIAAVAARERVGGGGGEYSDAAQGGKRSAYTKLVWQHRGSPSCTPHTQKPLAPESNKMREERQWDRERRSKKGEEISSCATNTVTLYEEQYAPILQLPLIPPYPADLIITTEHPERPKGDDRGGVSGSATRCAIITSWGWEG